MSCLSSTTEYCLHSLACRSVVVEPHLSILAPRLRPEAGVTDPLLLPLLRQLGNGSLREVRAHKGLQSCHDVIGGTNVTGCVHRYRVSSRNVDSVNNSEPLKTSMAGWTRSLPAGGGRRDGASKDGTKTTRGLLRPIQPPSPLSFVFYLLLSIER